MTSPTGFIDDGSHFFVTDVCNNTTYRFGPSGGDVSTALSSVNGLNYALAFAGGHYYGIAGAGTSLAQQGLYEFNPSTLAIVAGGPIGGALSLPHDMAVDPQSGDLFVTTGGSGVVRIHDPSGSPVLTTFVPFSASTNFDGAGWSPDGSIVYIVDSLSGHVFGYSRTGTLVFNVNPGHPPDGIAVAPPNDIVGGVNVSGNVFVNNNDGTVTRIDVNNGNALSTVASGGTRGDLAHVDTQGFFDVSQGDRYVRLVPLFFAPLGAPVSSSPAPSISGTAVAGNTLMCSSGMWLNSPTSFTYQWNRDGTAISGATSNAYTLTGADVDHVVTCTVTAGNAAGSSSATGAGVTVAAASTGTGTGSGTGSGTGTGAGAVAVACKITVLSSKVTVSKAKRGKKKKRKTQAVKVSVTCNQDATLTLNGKVMSRLKKKGKKKAKTKAYPLTALSGSTKANVATTFTLRLPSAALKALKQKAKESVSLTLTATNAKGGSSTTTASIAGLKAVK